MIKLADRTACTGCGACAAVCPRECIAMGPDKYGFPVPVIDPKRCVECGLCRKSCPVLNRPELENALPEAYAACATEESLRAESSSGGVFTELAHEVLDAGGVVFGAAYDEQFRVVHQCAEDRQMLAALRGAKYAQSDLGDTFKAVKEQLARGRQVLFAGTPCQVAGLRAFLGADDPMLITVDFVCHGVPSPMVWQKYVAYRAKLDNDGGLPASINLRSKESGWSHYRYSNLFVYPDGHSHASRSDESLFMKLFVGDYINRESCAVCSFKGCSRISDITLGDFWGIWDVLPEMDDDRGTSLVLIHSEKGRRQWAQICKRLRIRQVTPEQAGAQNPSLYAASPMKENRTQVLECILRGDFDDCEKLLNRRPPLYVRIGRRIRALVGKR